jgi:hypothetical protein
MPDGHRHIEGKTPLQIAPPSSHMLPSDESVQLDAKDIKDLD